MLITSTQLRKTFKDACSEAVDVYTSGNRKGWRRTSLLLLVCLLFSVLLSVFLLGLLHSLYSDTQVTGGAAGCLGILLTGALFASKRMRCLGILLVISCGKKQSRNLLITAGTCLVVLRHVQNTLDNLTRLSGSVICNMQAKVLSIDTAPLGQYVRMLKWLGGMLSYFTDYVVTDLISDLQVTSTVDSQELKDKLDLAEQALNRTVKSIRDVMHTLSLVQRMFPVLSLVLLMAFTMVNLKKYRNSLTYKNVFINDKFVRFDEGQKAEGKSHVLPLTPEEQRRYVSITSPRLTAREGKKVLKFSVPVFIHVVVWVAIAGVDTGMYWVVNSCLSKPTLLLYNSVVPLAAITAALVIMAVMATKLTQLRLIVCEQFFSTAAKERVEHLHARILRKRSKNRKSTKEGSLTSLLTQPQFWCPLLFRSKMDAG
ncbi:dendritic cell-specific transmembrane protein [Aplochiton taeniatus]